MKIVFVDNFSLNFGVQYLSAVLKAAGHQVELCNYLFTKSAHADIYVDPQNYFNFDKICTAVLNKKPDLIAFSVWSPNFQFYKRLAKKLKESSSIPILVGGVLPTLCPELFIPDTACDVVYRGEAEPQIVALVEAMVINKHQQISNIIYRDGAGGSVENAMTTYLDDLNALPFQDSTLYPNDSHAMYVISSRGCPYKCSYCSAGTNSRLVTPAGEKVIRKRDVRSVLDEIKATLARRPFKEIFFYDDFFITGESWLAEFKRLYVKEIGLPYYCLAFPPTINEKIAKDLAESGCKGVLMGFQTANTEYKKRVLQRPEPEARVLRAVNLLRDAGIMVSLDHILNLPGETREDIGLSLEFYVENKIDSLMVFFLNYYPDSQLTRYALEQGYLDQKNYDAIMANALVGEQSFRGTILNQEASDQQVRWAILMRLIILLPGRFVLWLFHKNLERFFPTNRTFYYAISGLAMAKGMGIRSLLNTLFLAFGLRSGGKK
ncbi:Radical SAM domain protein [Magnetococcus marinus MC-1]|uniref:Radical SAM domain protein n=1 Tax=Magnetococcus marinus (strain ATCC BAA-1437 / JCM 17883 / MC-1) TaxID=156889 RepID=A0L849_MAGMM|nr:radical SAM protein [Magnetococcus marinus]ABK44142.1 Radical SAM domain protein [Magnetococcus marinus MC-1]